MLRRISSYISLYAAFVAALTPSWGWTATSTMEQKILEVRSNQVEDYFFLKEKLRESSTPLQYRSISLRHDLPAIDDKDQYIPIEEIFLSTKSLTSHSGYIIEKLILPEGVEKICSHIVNLGQTWLIIKEILGDIEHLVLKGKIRIEKFQGQIGLLNAIGDESIIEFQGNELSVKWLSILSKGAKLFVPSPKNIQYITNKGELFSQHSLDFSQMDPSHLNTLGVIKTEGDLIFNLRNYNVFEFLNQYKDSFFALSIRITTEHFQSLGHLAIKFPLKLDLQSFLNEYEFETGIFSLTSKNLQNGTSYDKMGVLKSSHLTLKIEEEIQSEFGVIQSEELHLFSSKALKLLKSILIAKELYMNSDVSIDVSESIIDSIIQEYETPGLFTCVGTQFISNHPTIALLARQIFKVGKYEGSCSKTSEIIHNPMHEPNRLSKFGLGLAYNYERRDADGTHRSIVEDWNYVYSNLWGKMTEYFPRVLGRRFPGIDRFKESLQQRLKHHCSGNIWITAQDTIRMIGPEIKANRLFLKAYNPIEIVPLMIESKADFFHYMEGQNHHSYRVNYLEHLLEIESPSIELTCEDSIDPEKFTPVLDIQSDSSIILQSLHLKSKEHQWISLKAPNIQETSINEYSHFNFEDVDGRYRGQRWYQSGKYDERGHWLAKAEEEIWIPQPNMYDIYNLHYDCETGTSEYVELPHCHQLIDHTQHRSIISAIEDYQSSWGSITHGFESHLFDCKKQASVCRRVIGEKLENVQDESRPSQTLYRGDVREFSFASTLSRDQRFEAIQGVRSTVDHGNISGRSFDVAKVTLPEWRGSDVEKIQATAHALSQTSEAFTLVFNILSANPMGIAMQALSRLSVTSSSSTVTTKAHQTEEAAPAVYYGDTTIARPIYIEGVVALLAMKDPKGEIERIELRAPRYTLDTHTQEIHKSKSRGIVSYNETRTEINRYFGQKTDMPSYLMLMGQNSQLSIGNLHLTGTSLTRVDQEYDIHSLMNGEQGSRVIQNQEDVSSSRSDRGHISIQKAFIKAAIEETTQKTTVQSKTRGFNPLALMSGSFMRAVQWGHINDKDEGYTRRVADIDLGSSGSALTIEDLLTESNGVVTGDAAIASHGHTVRGNKSTCHTDKSPWTNPLILAQSALSIYDATSNIIEKSTSLSRLGDAQQYSRDIKRLARQQNIQPENVDKIGQQAFDHYLQTGEQDIDLNEGLAKVCLEKYEREHPSEPEPKSSSTQQHKTSSRSSSHVTGYDLYHSLDALEEDLDIDDPSLIMSGFMAENFLSDDDINPYTGYSESFKRDLSPTSFKLYEDFESASQEFETLKTVSSTHALVLAEQAFNERQDFSFANESRSQLFRAVKDGVVDTAEWAVENPFSAAYATGEMALSTAGAVMTGGRNAYEVAFHGKQLKSAAFETAIAFGALKYGVKAIKGVSRLVAKGVGVKKRSLVGNSKYERLIIHPNQNPYQFTSHVFGSKPTLWTAPNGTKQTYPIFKRNDIDWNMVRTSGIREFRGKTNLEAAKAGHAPQLLDGSTATLHHIGQDSRGALVEASRRYHGVDKGKAHDAIHSVYGRNKPHPEFPVDHDIFKLETKQYWKERVKDVTK